MARLRIDFDPARTAAYRAAGFWDDQVLRDWLVRNAGARGAHVALRAGETVVTHAQLRDAVARTANALARLGIAKGDVVAVQLPNGVPFVVAYLAIACVGAVMQTVHLAYRGADTAALLAHSGAVAVICTADGGAACPAQAFLAMRGSAAALREVVVAAGPAPAGARDLAALAAREGVDLPAVDLAGSDAFLLLYTSGTTASPKGVPHAYQDFLANARLSAEALAVTPEDILLCAAPFTHLYGLFTVNMALAVGAATVLLPAFSPPAFVEAIRQARPTIAFTAPAHIAACMQARLFDGVDLGCLKYVQMSGSAVPADLARALEPLLGGGKVMQLWGMTELQAGAYTRLDDPAPVRMESTGRASPGTELRVVDAAGRALAPGAEGELQMRGPSLFSGYLDNPEATRDAFDADRWFRTGDTATIDADGNVRLTGRVKDVINRGGVKFNPLEIETLMLRHPAVAEAAVAALPDPVLGERACCFVVLRPGARLALADVQQHLAAHGVSRFKWPERLEAVAAMPVTPTRKVIKGRLVSDWLARNPTRENPS
ncbi:MAG: acyl--CoA ligase [Burkholderiales bacterium]|nr:acyl--CoA ligase [Burkholderiales bacterium]